MGLFQQKDFISAAGQPLSWKIECDALTDADWETISAVCAPTLHPFERVVGVPNGGLPLAAKMTKYLAKKPTKPTEGLGLTLICEDVWTTGKSMLEFARTLDGDWIGLVAFARGKPPAHVHAFLRT